MGNARSGGGTGAGAGTGNLNARGALRALDHPSPSSDSLYSFCLKKNKIELNRRLYDRLYTRPILYITISLTLELASRTEIY